MKRLLIFLPLLVGSCAALRGYDWKVRITSDPAQRPVYCLRTDGTIRYVGISPIEITVNGGELPVWVKFEGRIIGHKLAANTEEYNFSSNEKSPPSDFATPEFVSLFDDVTKGEISKGYRPEMVVWAWGRPSSTSSHTSGNLTLDVWTYNRRTSYGIATAWQTVTFSNGKVSGWSNTDTGH